MVGAILLGFGGVGASVKLGFVHWGAISMAAGIGFVAGGIAWLADEPREQWSEIPVPYQHAGTFRSRLLALVALLVCCFPVVGLALGLAAVFANRDSRGWPPRISRIAANVAILVSFVVALAVLLDLALH